MQREFEVTADNLADLKTALVHDLARAKLADVKVRYRKGLLSIDTPLKKLSAYRFEYKGDVCVWHTEITIFKLSLKTFDVAQKATGTFWSMQLTESAMELAVKQSITNLLRRQRSPIRRTFILRSLRAISALEGLEEPALENAVAAPTDQSVIVNALQNEAAIAPIRELDPLAGARLRGIAAKQKLLESWGGSMSAAEAAAILKMSRQAIDKRRREGKLLAIELGKRGFYYPEWQLQLKGLPEVLKALANHDPWMQLSFFVNPNDLLQGRTPIESLKTGHLQQVVKAAENYGEHGA